jgi:CDGSH-type Zn-finger protein
MTGRHSAAPTTTDAAATDAAIDAAAPASRAHDDAPIIIACPDGPLLVRGHIELTTPDGEPIEQHRRTVALCRCGVSTIKPFCDGTHKAVHFRTEPVVTAQAASDR